MRHAVTPEGDPAALGLPPLDTAFLRVVADAQRLGAAAPVPGRIGPELDGLAEEWGPGTWRPAQFLAYLRLSAIPPTRRAAVVTIVRDEGLALLEFVAHYRALGFDAIYVYSNDNVDGSDMLLGCLAGHGAIVHIDNVIAPGTNPQRKAYAHALHMLPAIRAHEWAFFVDADEFLVPAPDPLASIGDMLDRAARHFSDGPPAALCFDWRWYLSGGRFAWEPGLVLERFRHAVPTQTFKSLVRLAAATSMARVHGPDTLPGMMLARSDFSLFPPADMFRQGEPRYAGGQLNHYWLKSFEEFSIKKARGDVLALKNRYFVRDFEQFFAQAAETAANLAPPPAALVGRVKAEMARLAALPGMARALREVRDRVPAMMARFDGAGGLRQLYEAARAAAAKPG